MARVEFGVSMEIGATIKTNDVRIRTRVDNGEERSLVSTMVESLRNLLETVLQIEDRCVNISLSSDAHFYVDKAGRISLGDDS